jgi:hypothetical protein
MSFFTVYELVINLDHNIPSSEGQSVLKFTKDNLHHPEMENVKKKLHTYPYYTSDLKYPSILRNLDYATRVEIFFNKTEFVKYLTNYTSESKIDLTPEQRVANNNHNVLFMIELLFPTKFPTYNDISDSYNRFIKNNTGISNIQLGLITNFFNTKYYSYINYQGSIYTFRRSIWLNDFLNHPGYYDLRNSYEKFIIWQNQSLANIQIAKNKELENEFNEIFIWFKEINRQIMTERVKKNLNEKGHAPTNKFIDYYILILHTFFKYRESNTGKHGKWSTNYDPNDQRNLIKPFLENKVLKYLIDMKNENKKHKKNPLWIHNTPYYIYKKENGAYKYGIDMENKKAQIGNRSDYETSGIIEFIRNNKVATRLSTFLKKMIDNPKIFEDTEPLIKKINPAAENNSEKKEVIYKGLSKRTFITNSYLINRVLKDSVPEEYSNLYYTIAGSGGSGYNRLSSYKGKSRVKAGNSQLQERINSIQIDDMVSKNSSGEIYDNNKGIYNTSVEELFQFLDYVYTSKIKGQSSFTTNQELPRDVYEEFLNIGITTNENNNPKQYEIYLMVDFFKGEINDTNKDKLLCDYTSNRLGQLFEDITVGKSSGKIEPWNAKTHRLELMDLNDIEKAMQKEEEEEKNTTSNNTMGDNNTDNYYTSNNTQSDSKISRILSEIINQLNIAYNLKNAQIDVKEEEIQEEILNIVDSDIINIVMDKSRVQDKRILLEINKIINNFKNKLSELEIEIKNEKDYNVREDLKKQNVFYNELLKIPKFLLENEEGKPQSGGKKRKSRKSKEHRNKRITRKNKKN